MSKYACAHMAALTFEQGAVWYMNRQWAEDLITKCAECHFDGSDATDDIEETVVNAAIWVRQSYSVELPQDIDEEAEALASMRKPKRHFYGSR